MPIKNISEACQFLFYFYQIKISKFKYHIFRPKVAACSSPFVVKGHNFDLSVSKNKSEYRSRRLKKLKR